MLDRFFQETSGAEAVELALVVPIFLLLVLASLQLAIVGMMRYEVKYLTSLAARQLAIAPDTTDSSLLAFVEAQNMPALQTAGISTFTTTPSCAALSGGHCSGRTSGSEVTVEMVYNASNVYFMPSFFGFSLASTTVGSHVSIFVE